MDQKSPCYLKSSGGDWNNIADMNTQLNTWLVSGLTMHIEVRAENGVTFGNYTSTDRITLTVAGGKFNGFTITIHSDIVTPTSPAILKLHGHGPIVLTDNASNSDSGGLVVENFILKQYNVGQAGSHYNIDNNFLWSSGRYFTYQNNLVYTFAANNFDYAHWLNVSDTPINGSGLLKFISNSLYVSDAGGGISYMRLKAASGGSIQAMFANNSVGCISIQTLYLETGKNKSNNVYAYNGNPITVDGTPVNLTKLDPRTVQTIIVGINDSIDTMAARNPELTSLSPLLHFADWNFSPTYDLKGRSRL